jgi:hypothetical protein
MASIIDPESAKSLITEYKQQNASPGGPAIKTNEGQLLSGYFLDRQSLETILSNPKVEGVSLHLAKHPDSVGSAENYFTVVYAGAEPNTSPNPATPYVNTGAVYGDVPPCPNFCSDVG